jgi:hypothetical protein
LPNKPPKREREQGPGIESTPRFPETTPPLAPSADYTWVLETVMTMHNSMGKLEEAVDNLKTTQTQQGLKLDGIDKKIYAAIAVIVVFGSILTFFANSINSALSNRISPTVQQQSQPSPTPSTTPTPAKNR